MSEILSLIAWLQGPTQGNLSSSTLPGIFWKQKFQAVAAIQRFICFLVYMKDRARGRGRLASKIQLKWRNVFLENVRPDAPEVQPDPYTPGLELYSYQWLFRQLLFSTKSKVLPKKNPTEVSHNSKEHRGPFRDCCWTEDWPQTCRYN